jgi:hypothetical protein
MIAFVACSNGLGHIKRIITICNYIYSNYGITGTVFAPKKKFDHLTKILKKQKDIIYIPKLIDFDTETSIDSWGNSSSKNWKQTIPSLESFKLVVSDNLLEILELRSDAIILASFFWDQIVIKNDLTTKRKNLIKKYNPLIIGNKYLSLTPKTKNYRGVGFCLAKRQLSHKTKKNLLISGGKDGSDDKLINEIVKYFINNKPSSIDYILLEPRLFNISMPKYFKKADFSSDMYNSIIMAIIRPGLGTVTDCLNHQAFILSFKNFNNYELNQNIRNLKKLGVGDVFENMLELSLIIEKFGLKKNIFYENLSKIDFNGTKQTSEIIYKIYCEK